ncbi:hypothetical protein [Streptomyces sp. NPDC002463]|uniref:hypothetical protein n=1 Tax=Streptomyces sp. NPDC002463 TaxID=3364645 RepID=UPI003673F89F
MPPRWTARIDNASPTAAAGLAWVLQPWRLVAAGAATALDALLSRLIQHQEQLIVILSLLIGLWLVARSIHDLLS